MPHAPDQTADIAGIACTTQQMRLRALSNWLPNTSNAVPRCAWLPRTKPGIRGNQAQNGVISRSILKNKQRIDRQCLAQHAGDLF